MKKSQAAVPLPRSPPYNVYMGNNWCAQCPGVHSDGEDQTRGAALTGGFSADKETIYSESAAGAVELWDGLWVPSTWVPMMSLVSEEDTKPSPRLCPGWSWVQLHWWNMVETWHPFKPNIGGDLAAAMLWA